MDKIDIRDLRVGNWVYYNPNVFIEDEYVPSKNIEILQIKSGKDIDLIIENCYAPIPLTKEILEKNGFEEDGEGVYGDDNSYFIPTYQSGTDTGTWEAHIEPDEGIGDFGGKLRYVHQLQNILRDLGIEKEIIL